MLIRTASAPNNRHRYNSRCKTCVFDSAQVEFIFFFTTKNVIHIAYNEKGRTVYLSHSHSPSLSLSLLSFTNVWIFYYFMFTWQFSETSLPFTISSSFFHFNPLGYSVILYFQYQKECKKCEIEEM